MRVHYEVATTCTASADFVQLGFFLFFFQKAHAPCEVCFGEQTIHE